jgi:hypothetical protein
MKNEVYDLAQELYLPVPEYAVSGSPVALGQLPGVCQTNRDGNGKASVKMRGADKFKVKGENGSGGSAVAEGDIIYINAGTGVLSKIATGVRFGYALGTVGSGSEATILVKIGY